MDIWKWFWSLQDELRAAGRERDAYIIFKIPSCVADVEPERVEALMPEALALAREIENPWLEVFIRHWSMQNRLNNCMEGASAMGDVIALFEYAHRKETQGCPQSVCVTQDMSICYGNTDGPGSVDERIEICDETLSRIDPTWPCFRCISDEKAKALLDHKRPEEAYEYVLLQQKLAHEAGVDYDNEFGRSRVDALILMGNFSQAVAELDRLDVSKEDDTTSRLARAFQRTKVFSGLGQDQEAWNSLPSLDDLHPGDLGRWFDAAGPLMLRNLEWNTWQLGRALQVGIRHFAKSGSHRYLIDLALTGVRLAIARGAPWVGRRLCDAARAQVPLLLKDCGASAAIALAEAELEAFPTTCHTPVAASGLIDYLAEVGAKQERNPELELEWLLEGAAQRPDDPVLIDQLALALRACGAPDEALAQLWNYVGRHPEEESDPIFSLLELLVDEGLETEVLRLANMLAPVQPIISHWCNAKRGGMLGEPELVERHCRALLELRPESIGALRLLGESLLRQGRFCDAAATQQARIALDEGNQDAQWDYLVSATAARDWGGVRQVAAQLGFELGGGEGPIEEKWAWTLIRFQEREEALTYYAQRTGPVTARIFQNAKLDRQQHAMDVVVFNPTPLEPWPEEQEARDKFVPTYSFVHTLDSAGFSDSWFVDGVNPGGEVYSRLCEKISAIGGNTWTHSGDQYFVIDPDTGERTLPGLYFSIALPGDVPPELLHRLLTAETEGLAHPLSWTGLAKACAHSIESHLATVERYGL